MYGVLVYPHGERYQKDIIKDIKVYKGQSKGHRESSKGQRIWRR